MTDGYSKHLNLLDFSVKRLPLLESDDHYPILIGWYPKHL